jgi:DNA ligase-1
MISPVSIIENLSSTTKRIQKEQILLDAFMNSHREFFIGAQLAYDPLVTFGVKKVPEIIVSPGDEETGGTLTFTEFLTLAVKLRSRELTGHAARDAMRDAAENCDIKVWNTFYRRILLKDFRCGIDTSTINKILKRVSQTEPDAKGLMIPVFACQLAFDGVKEEHQKKVSGRKMLDIKLDGVRLLTVLDKETGQITQYTRNGKVNENFTEIRDSLKTLLDSLPGSVVLDGEVISKNFQDLMKQVNRREGVDTTAARLAVFDIIPLNAFREGFCATPQELRHAFLCELEMQGLFKKATNGVVYVIPKVTVDLDTLEGQATFTEFNRQAIEAEYEGVMVKDPSAPYTCKRTFAWLKIKPFIEVSLEIIGFYPGEAGKQFANSLGGFIMRGEDDGRMIEVDCGGGFSQAEREEYWSKRDSMIGMIGEVRADKLSMEEGSTVWSLRFPRWKNLRGTEPGEKL